MSKIVKVPFDKLVDQEAAKKIFELNHVIRWQFVSENELEFAKLVVEYE